MITNNTSESWDKNDMLTYLNWVGEHITHTQLQINIGMPKSSAEYGPLYKKQTKKPNKSV